MLNPNVKEFHNQQKRITNKLNTALKVSNFVIPYHYENVENENQAYNYKYFNDYNEYINFINDTKTNHNFELLTNDIVKPYFDVDKIKLNKKQLEFKLLEFISLYKNR